jgi:hypothetical protein
MSGVEVTIRVKQEGVEEAQAQVQRLKTEMQGVKTDASLLSKVTSLSLSKFMIAVNLVANISFAAFDLLGIAIDKMVKSMIQMLLNYATQISMIATAHATAGSIATAATLSTFALALQVAGVQQMERMGNEAKMELNAGKTALQSVSQLIRTVG